MYMYIRMYIYAYVKCMYVYCMINRMHTVHMWPHTCHVCMHIFFYLCMKYVVRTGSTYMTFAYVCEASCSI
jgi:hypothetical protein